MQCERHKARYLAEDEPEVIYCECDAELDDHPLAHRPLCPIREDYLEGDF